MKVGDRIRAKRIDLGLSVDELAARLGKNRATVYRYEKGDIENLPVSVLEPLAKALQTTPEYLMGWADDTKTAPTAENREGVGAETPVENLLPAGATLKDYAKGDWLQRFAADLPDDKTALLEDFDRLNAEGRRKAAEYVKDLVLTGRYKKD